MIQIPAHLVIHEETFKRWIEKLPRTAQFNYYDSSECPIAAFGREILLTELRVGGSTYSDGNKPVSLYPLPSWLWFKMASCSKSEIIKKKHLVDTFLKDL